MTSPTGDVHFRRYSEVASLASRPLATSTSVRNGDRVFARAERVMSTLVGPPGARYWEEEGFGAASGFGDGSDGPLVLAAPLTLTRDMYWTTVHLLPGAVLNPGGFRMYASESFQVDAGAFVLANGNAAVGAVAGAATPSGSVAGGSAGGAGGVNAAGTAGTGFAGPALLNPNGNDGGAGGAGGVNAGGAGGVTVRSPNEGTLHLLSAALNGRDIGPLGPGSGGGGGGSNNVAGHGGGGGGGAGIVLIGSPHIINNGVIDAVGGAGAAGLAADGGGGGGGGGGVVLLVAFQNSGAGLTSANGGAGGAPSGAGIAGAPGVNGTVFLYQA